MRKIIHILLMYVHFISCNSTTDKVNKDHPKVDILKTEFFFNSKIIFDSNKISFACVARIIPVPEEAKPILIKSFNDKETIGKINDSMMFFQRIANDSTFEIGIQNKIKFVLYMYPILKVKITHYMFTTGWEGVRLYGYMYDKKEKLNIELWIEFKRKDLLWGYCDEFEKL